MGKAFHESFVDAFEGRILKVDRIYDYNRSGYTLALLIFVPDTASGMVDELEIYRRVAQVVNVVSPEQ